MQPRTTCLRTSQHEPFDDLDNRLRDSSRSSPSTSSEKMMRSTVSRSGPSGITASMPEHAGDRRRRAPSW